MANQLKLIRTIKGKTQVELALETGFSQTMVSNFENSLSEPTQVEKERLAGALGVSVSDIFGLANVIEVRLVASRKRDNG
jgi:transcriptional regulator with XRE-family HTH domain